MEDFVIATNSDGRVEAFYIENGTVMHTWQINGNDKLVWSQPGALTSTKEARIPLTNATRVEACTGLDGQIQVVAFTADNQYKICYQTPGVWNGWFDIVSE